MASLEEDISDVEDNRLNKEAVAKYSPISESLRSSIPESQMCLMFCGGRNCKYETANKWPNDQAVVGLYSSWVTQNILAMSRPNTDMIDKFNIIQQFKDNNIKSIINLQMLGEHEHCGPGLESSGFTYQPQAFMDAHVSFYNYGWRDYGVGSMKNLVDVVQVMQFAISEGKVAIHCHAGLGRTGVLIACYLVYSNRTQPQVAINYIRSKRPGSIQSNCQIQCISEFYKILLPMRIIFNLPQSSVTSSCTLSGFLARQKYFVHGREAKLLKHLPKIVFVCCNRLMDLAGVLCKKEEHILRRCALDFVSSSKHQNPKKTEALSSNHLSTTSETVGRSISSESFCPIPFLQKVFSNPDLPLVSSRSSTNDGKLERKGTSKSDVLKAMSRTTYDKQVLEALDDLRRELNSSDSGWKSLEIEENPEVLSCILWSWIDDLKEPILTHQDLPVVIDETTSIRDKISLLEKCAVATISYLLVTCLALHPLPPKPLGKVGQNDIHFQLMQRIISTLVHQNCVLEGDDVTNDLDDEYFLRSSNQVGSVMRLDLGRRIYRHLLTVEAVVALCHCLILSRLDYCDSLLHQLSSASLRKLQKIQTKASRLVIGGKAEPFKGRLGGTERISPSFGKYEKE